MVWNFSHWQTTIQVNRTFGTPFNCGLGVPWGGMLSLTLFSIYINDVVWSFRFWELSTICRRHLKNSFWLSAYSYVWKMPIWAWQTDSMAIKMRLKAYRSKTDLLVFHVNCDVPKLSGELINKCSSTNKVIGITVDVKLNFEAHLNWCKNADVSVNTSIRYAQTYLHVFSNQSYWM